MICHHEETIRKKMSLSTEFNCSICYEPYDTPKALPCLHTFCQRCIDQFSNSGTICCPECHSVHTVPFAGFPTNIAFQRALNSLRIRQSLVSEETPLLRENRPRHEDLVDPLGPVEATAPLLENDGDDNVVSGRCSNCRTHCTAKWLFGIVPSIRWTANNLLTEFLRRYKHYIVHTSVLFLMIALSRLIAGSVKLTSNCPMEHKVALYLFVKSWCAFVYWIVLLILSKTTEIDEMMENPWIEGYVKIDGIFSLIWFIIGTVWSSGSYNEMTVVCPKFIPDWNRAFVFFSVFLNVVDWIGVVAFTFYIGFIGCRNRDEMG